MQNETNELLKQSRKNKVKSWRPSKELYKSIKSNAKKNRKSPGVFLAWISSQYDKYKHIIGGK